jgi:Tol biopolymer transport system component
MFTSDKLVTSYQLFRINLGGTNLVQISDIPGIRGRSDWARYGNQIATYAGDAWKHNIFIMQADGTNVRQITDGGNCLAPSFSPDGQWIVFTGYIDLYGDDLGCEIYTMKIDGSNVKRLTKNDYCDWQPRWGP